MITITLSKLIFFIFSSFFFGTILALGLSYSLFLLAIKSYKKEEALKKLELEAEKLLNEKKAESKKFKLKIIKKHPSE